MAKKKDEYAEFSKVLRAVLSADPKAVREQEKKMRKPKKASASARVSRDKD